MSPESNAPQEEQAVKLPNEVWSLALSSGRVQSSFWASVRLLDGTVLDDMIISPRGYVLGKLMDGLAGAHGGIDSSMLTFRTPEIEGIKIGRRRLWQRPVWLLLNPEHPGRRECRGSHTAPQPRKQRTLRSLRTMIIVGIFFSIIIAVMVFAVIGFAYACGWLK